MNVFEVLDISNCKYASLQLDSDGTGTTYHKASFHLPLFFRILYVTPSFLELFIKSVTNYSKTAGFVHLEYLINPFLFYLA
jgi:hypothetical protein